MAPLRAFAAPLALLLGARGAHASDESLSLVQTASLVGAAGAKRGVFDPQQLLGDPETFKANLLKALPLHEFPKAEHEEHEEKMLETAPQGEVAPANPVRKAFSEEIDSLRNEFNIELARRRSMPRETVKGLARLGVLDVGNLNVLSMELAKIPDIDTAEKTAYFKGKLQPFYKKLRGEEGTSYFIAQDGDSCREGPTLYMERVLFQLREHAPISKKNLVARSINPDFDSLKRGTCASAGYGLASAWSGCFPAARAWVKEAPTSLSDLEETPASWADLGGKPASWRSMVEALCINRLL